MINSLNFKSNKNKNLIFGVALLISIAVLVSAGYFGYVWYRTGIEQAAYRDLSQNMESFFKKTTLVTSAADWQVVEQAFATGADRHKSSHLYPYFLGFQADALIEQDKHSQALDVMNKMLMNLDKNQPLYPLYFLKRSRLKLDSSDKKIEQEGRNELNEMGSNQKNVMWQAALYYLGLDYWFKNDMNKARDIWNQIVKNSAIEKEGEENIWVALIKSKVGGNL